MVTGWNLKSIVLFVVIVTVLVGIVASSVQVTSDARLGLIPVQELTTVQDSQVDYTL